MTKLKIDVNGGLVEVEGDDQFVKSIYDDYKDIIFKGIKTSNVDNHEIKKNQISATSLPAQVNKNKSKGSGKRRESYTFVKDLDLSNRDGKKSLKDFIAEKTPSKAKQHNAVFVYYLQKIKEVANITPDHIYTCYKEVGAKIPGALRQSITDTSGKQGWLSTSNMNDIQITTIGENLVELDLPKKHNE